MGLLYIDRSMGLLYVDQSMGLLYIDQSMGLLYVDQSMGLLYIDWSTGLLYVDRSIGLLYIDRTMGLLYDIILPINKDASKQTNRDVQNRFFISVRFLKKLKIQFGMSLVRFGSTRCGSVRIL